MVPPPEKSFGIEALLQLIQQWFDASFATASQKTRIGVNSTWIMVAWLLCGSPEHDCYRAIAAEIMQQAREGHEGAPPLLSIEHRLRELVAAGLQEGFLSVAIRDALEDLITLNHPSFLRQWIHLADQIVPRKMRLSERGHLPPSPQAEISQE